MQAAEAGHFAEALVALRTARALGEPVADPCFLLGGIAICEEALGRPGAALRAWRETERCVPSEPPIADDPPAARLARVRGHIQRLGGAVGRIEVRCLMRDTAVRVASDLEDMCPAEFEVDPGLHTVTGGVREGAPYEVSVQVAAGERVRVQLGAAGSANTEGLSGWHWAVLGGLGAAAVLTGVAVALISTADPEPRTFSIEIGE